MIHRIGFMSQKDIDDFIIFLENDLSLIFIDGNRKSIDIVVIDMISGPTSKCDWIGFKRGRLFNHRTEYLKYQEDFSIAWQIECFEGDIENYAMFYPENKLGDSGFKENGISLPFGWNPDKAIYTSDFSSKPDEELEEICRTEGLITYRKKNTGEIVYVGISKIEKNDKLTDENTDLVSKLFKKASERFEPYVLIDNESYGIVGWFVELKIKKSIKELKQCLEIIPNHINSIFLIGKCYQSLGENNLSLQFFEQGLAIEFPELTYEEDYAKFVRLTNYCLLEASVIYAKIGNFDMAINYSNRLIDKDPDNIVVLTNQAMNFIIKGMDSVADTLLGKAITIAPSDLISNKVLEFHDKVKLNLISRPRTWNEFA